MYTVYMDRWFYYYSIVFQLYWLPFDCLLIGPDPGPTQPGSGSHPARIRVLPGPGPGPNRPGALPGPRIRLGPR